jgi:hypothetical protein
MLPTSPVPVPEPLALLDATLLFLIQVLLARHPDLLAADNDNDDTHLPEYPLGAVRLSGRDEIIDTVGFLGRSRRARAALGEAGGTQHAHGGGAGVRDSEVGLAVVVQVQSAGRAGARGSLKGRSSLRP